MIWINDVLLFDFFNWFTLLLNEKSSNLIKSQSWLNKIHYNNIPFYIQIEFTNKTRIITINI